MANNDYDALLIFMFKSDWSVAKTTDTALIMGM